MDYYVGEIRLFAGAYAPEGWLPCDGSLQPVSQYQALFALIGTMYGGDGVKTFGLPNLNGNVIVGAGASDPASPAKVPTAYAPGQHGGATSTTLSETNLPVHSHLLMATTNAATSLNPNNMVLADPSDQYSFYVPVSSQGKRAPLLATALQTSGMTVPTPFNNVKPTIALTYIIAPDGLFPDLQ